MLATILIIVIISSSLRMILHALDKTKTDAHRFFATIFRLAWIGFVFYYLIRYVPFYN